MRLLGTVLLFNWCNWCITLLVRIIENVTVIILSYLLIHRQVYGASRDLYQRVDEQGYLLQLFSGCSECGIYCAMTSYIAYHYCVINNASSFIVPLMWRHNDSLLNRLFRRRSMKTSKLRVTGLRAGIHRRSVNSPHKVPVTRKMFSFDDVIRCIGIFWNWSPQKTTCISNSHQRYKLVNPPEQWVKRFRKLSKITHNVVKCTSNICLKGDVHDHLYIFLLFFIWIYDTYMFCTVWLRDANSLNMWF